MTASSTDSPRYASASAFSFCRIIALISGGTYSLSSALTRTSPPGPLRTSYGTIFISSETSSNLRPMKRLIEKIVFSGFVTCCRFAGAPTSRWPSFVNATTDGVVRPPSAFGITVGSPPSITAMQELVVPRSIPITFAMSRFLQLSKTPSSIENLSPCMSSSGYGCACVDCARRGRLPNRKAGRLARRALRGRAARLAGARHGSSGGSAAARGGLPADRQARRLRPPPPAAREPAASLLDARGRRRDPRPFHLHRGLRLRPHGHVHRRRGAGEHPRRLRRPGGEGEAPQQGDPAAHEGDLRGDEAVGRPRLPDAGHRPGRRDDAGAVRGVLLGRDADRLGGARPADAGDRRPLRRSRRGAHRRRRDRPALQPRGTPRPRRRA